MGFSDNFYKKVERKTNVNKETILNLAKKIQGDNLKDENKLRDLIKEISSITGKDVSKEKEDKIVSAIVNDKVPKNIDKISFGKAISSITTSVNEISIYGDQETVNKYSESYIPIEVDVAGLADNKTYTVVVPKPEGIREVSEKTITVKISIGKEESKEVDDIKIDAINLGPNLKAGAIGENSSKTTVIIKGTKEVLNSIDPTTIKATVDLSGLGEGEHSVSVNVTGDDVKASYFAKTSKIKVRINKS